MNLMNKFWVAGTMRYEFEKSLRRNAERVAAKDLSGRTMTYSELERRSRAVMHQLADLRIGPGDVVAIYMKNSLEWIVADVAINRLGAIKLPVNTLLPESTVEYILEASATKALIVDDLTLISGVSAVKRLETDAPTILHSSEDAYHPGTLPFSGVAGIEDPGFVSGLDKVHPEDYAALYFTGGTTGKPKGVHHTQSSTVALHIAQMLEAEIREEDKLLLMTPMAHAAGLFMQTAILRGATCIIAESFDAADAWQIIERENVTWTFLVPTMIYRMLDSYIPAVNCSALQTIVYGAAPISHERLAQALDIFGRVFIQLYGQTECPNWGTRLSKNDHDLARPELLSTAGKSSIMAEVKIITAEGEDAGTNTVGEVCIRAPYVLSDYLGDPDATLEKFLGEWIKTGDVGTLDESGYLRLLDRKSDIVISGGMNVYCSEVEDALNSHPEVQVAAVIGIPHEEWGEAVHAVVVPTNEHLSEIELTVWAKNQLARYAVPKSIDFVERLPETPLGKIDKVALRRPYWRERVRGVA